jgi:hypothetical protein
MLKFSETSSLILVKSSSKMDPVPTAQGCSPEVTGGSRVRFVTLGISKPHQLTLTAALAGVLRLSTKYNVQYLRR